MTQVSHCFDDVSNNTDAKFFLLFQFQQFCSRCKIKFAEYFCSICKHLTGTDDNPYHCDKCGICRYKL